MKTKRVSAYQLSYKDFSYKHEPKHPNYVSQNVYKRILKEFFKKLAEYLITSGKEIVLPSRLGSLQAVKYLPTKKKVDFGNTLKYYGEHNKTNKEDKKVIYHNNVITKGWLPKIYWSKIVKANFLNKRKWKLSLTRPNIRPNEYNKTNPSVSLMPFFQKEGYRLYEKHNPYLKRQLYERSKNHKSYTTESSGGENTKPTC